MYAMQTPYQLPAQSGKLHGKRKYQGVHFFQWQTLGLRIQLKRTQTGWLFSCCSHSSSTSMQLNKLAQTGTCLTCIQNVIRETLTILRYSVVSLQPFKANAPTILKLKNDNFIPHPFQQLFTYSSYCLTVCSLNYRQHCLTDCKYKYTTSIKIGYYCDKDGQIMITCNCRRLQVKDTEQQIPTS
jgi:hypothetical protein